MWQSLVKPYVQAGALTVVGVVQEQHPDRARLYRQWRALDWPIFVDALNELGVAAVPIAVAIDASGVVRAASLRPSRLAHKFMELRYEPIEVADGYNRATAPDIPALQRTARRDNTADAWRALGDAWFITHGDGAMDRAVEAFERAVAVNPKDGRAQFRLGVALRRRSESVGHRPGDAQEAVRRWGLALAVDPNQYIWRRRIQQYGPRLDKPYNFYFWVDEARAAVRARGDTPVTLAVEPLGSEIAPPDRGATNQSAPTVPDPDPEGRLRRDAAHLVGIEPVVTPHRVRPGRRVRVRLTFRLDERTKPFWNNEYKGLVTSLVLPSGLSVTESALRYPNAARPETREVRVLECEIAVGTAVAPGNLTLPAYAVYDVCENERGVCHHLRQDFSIVVHVDPSAPTG
ncbi:MAG: hypothetical protein ACE5E6_01535 [Phycisphaerae bacterium]